MIDTHAAELLHLVTLLPHAMLAMLMLTVGVLGLRVYAERR
jgi:hypothetical protein